MTPTPARAFTLLETFIVIVIVTVLASIGIGVTTSMADAGRIRATEGVLRTLDEMVASYIDQRGTNPPAIVSFSLEETLDADGTTYNVGDIVYFTPIDGRLIDGNDNPRVNSVGLFLKSVEGVLDTGSLLSQIDSDLLRTYDAPDDGQPGMLTLFDAWGNPIRYVHPRYDGVVEEPGTQRALGEEGTAYNDILDDLFTDDLLPADTSSIVIGHSSSPYSAVRRNKLLQTDREEARAIGIIDLEADSDGGVCPGGRPYFYSAGRDGDPSTIEDNIYTVVPDFIDPL